MRRRPFRGCPRGSLPVSSTPSTPPDPYQPLTFLIGHCWKGALPGGQRIDEVDPQSGKAQTARSRWQRTAEDAYEVLTEFQAGDGWVLGFKARMQRVKDAAAS